MTPQLKAALVRSIGPALLAALAAAGTAAGQVQLGGDPFQVAVTIALGAFVSGMIVFYRGVLEGLSDGQRAAKGDVREADVTPLSLSSVEAVLNPLIEKALAKLGVNVTDSQVNAFERAVEAEVQDAASEPQDAQEAPPAESPAPEPTPTPEAAPAAPLVVKDPAENPFRPASS